MSDGRQATEPILSGFTLRRITTSGNYIPEVDGLRFAAILAVVLFHVPIQIALRSAEQSTQNPFWHLVSNGHRGVELFFLISGFILGMPFASHLLCARKPVRLRDYFMRRVTRLEPPYILSILARLPFLVLYMHRPLRSVLIHGLASLLYLHNLIFGVGSSVSPPAWSLEIEIQFYCLAPLFALAYFKIRPAWLRRLLGLTFLIAAGIIQLSIQHGGDETRFTISILNYVQYFFAGFLLVDLYLTDWDRIPVSWLWDIASLGAWCWIFEAEGPAVHILLPVIALIAYIGAFKGRIFPSFFRLRWVSLIGGMCYSIYLTHGLANSASGILCRYFSSALQLSPFAEALTAYTIALPMTLLLGLLLYIAVERPCMDKNWPHKLAEQFRTGRNGGTAVRARGVSQTATPTEASGEPINSTKS